MITLENVAKNLLRMMRWSRQSGGGFTVPLLTQPQQGRPGPYVLGPHPRDGYVVSTIMAAELPMEPPWEWRTIRDWLATTESHWRHGNIYGRGLIGCWHSDHVAVFDIVQVISDRDLALELAAMWNQFAVYDLTSNESIVL